MSVRLTLPPTRSIGGNDGGKGGNGGGKDDSACEALDYKGDGNCDDDNNNDGCDYDGGDCCAKSVKNGKVKTKFCNEVVSSYLLL